MFELYVFENPRELNLPPPRDIFGGDTPAGIGVAGMRDLPVWAGRDPDATRGMRAGDEYLWPEEKEEDEAVHGTEGSGDDWTQGAGTKELSTARQMEYQEVEDVILTGERKKRVPKVTIEVRVCFAVSCRAVPCSAAFEMFCLVWSCLMYIPSHVGCCIFNISCRFALFPALHHQRFCLPTPLLDSC